MKAYLNIAALAATMLAAPAFADTSTLGEMIDYPQNMMQASNARPLTRAEVVSQIPAQGTPWGDAIDYPQGYVNASNAPARTRAEVRAELEQAVASGTRPSGSINYPDAF